MDVPRQLTVACQFLDWLLSPLAYHDYRLQEEETQTSFRELSLAMSLGPDGAHSYFLRVFSPTSWLCCSSLHTCSSNRSQIRMVNILPALSSASNKSSCVLDLERILFGRGRCCEHLKAHWRSIDRQVTGGSDSTWSMTNAAAVGATKPTGAGPACSFVINSSSVQIFEYSSYEFGITGQETSTT